MTGISAQNGVITLINVFTVDPVNQRRLIELLTEATEVSVRRAPGDDGYLINSSASRRRKSCYAKSALP